MTTTVTTLLAMLALSLAAAVAMAAAPAPAPGPPPGVATPAAPSPALLPTIVERVQRNYDQARDFRARFSQKYTNVTFERIQVSTGEVLFKKPGRMRWNYDKPDEKMFLSTGQVLWLYEPEDNRAFKQDLRGSPLPAALAFLMGAGKLSDEFEIAFAGAVPYGKASDFRLSLKPKKPQGTYKSIYFIVDANNFLVVESVLVDAQGNVNDITFSDMKVNTKLGDGVFAWSPPKGARVIDAAKMQ